MLREIFIHDWRDIHGYSSDHTVVDYLPWEPNSEEDCIRHVLQMISGQKDVPRNEYHLAIATQENDQAIGCCSLVNRDAAQNEEAWIGYVLHRNYWGRGYMTEAVEAIMQMAFEELGFLRLLASCDARNLASARVLEKSGMLRGACKKRHTYRKGAWRDFIFFSLERADWEDRIGKQRMSSI